MIAGIAKLGAWTGSLIGVLLLLVAAGDSSLAVPTDDWSTWVQNSDPAVVVFGLLRVAALFAVSYLLLNTLLASASALLDWKPLSRAIRAITLPSIDKLVGGALGVTVAVSLNMPATAGAATTPSEYPILRNVTGATAVPTPTVPTAVHPTEVEVAVGPVDVTYTIRKGDNLWNVARNDLAAVLQREPDPGETEAHCRALIELNRDRLKDRHDPSLVYPGQVFVLPR